MEAGEHDWSGQIELVYRRRYGNFLRVAAAIVGDERLAEEAIHDGFVRALRHRRRFEQRGSLEAWLWRIVVNEARRRRVLETRMPLASLPLLDGVPDTATVTANGDCEGRAVEAFLAALPERQRLALFLRYYADLDYAAIATALAVKPGTVAATLNAAHAALRRQLLEVE